MQLSWAPWAERRGSSHSSSSFSVFGKHLLSQSIRERAASSHCLSVTRWVHEMEQRNPGLTSLSLTAVVEHLTLSKSTPPLFLVLYRTSSFTKHFHIHYLSRTLRSKPGRYRYPIHVSENREFRRLCNLLKVTGSKSLSRPGRQLIWFQSHIRSTGYADGNRSRFPHYTWNYLTAGMFLYKCIWKEGRQTKKKKAETEKEKKK